MAEIDDPGPASFDGFPGGLAVLDEFGAAEPERHDELHRRWTATLLPVANALVEAVGPRLRARVSPTLAYAAAVNGSISPITRDLRFAADRSRRYKDYLMLKFWDGEPRALAPTLWVRLSATDAGYAAGAHFAPPGLERWRARLVEPAGAELAGMLQGLSERRGATLGEPELKRPTIDAAAGSAVAELSRHKSFQVRFRAAHDGSERRADFAETVVDGLNELQEVHAWLVRWIRG